MPEINRETYERLAASKRQEIVDLLSNIMTRQSNSRQRIQACLADASLVSLLAVAQDSQLYDFLEWNIWVKLNHPDIRKNLQYLIDMDPRLTTLVTKASVLIDPPTKP